MLEMHNFNDDEEVELIDIDEVDDGDEEMPLFEIRLLMMTNDEDDEVDM